MLKGLLLGLGRFAACCVVAMFSMAALGQALPKVVYVGSTWYGHAPVWVGIEKGLFKNEGFDVEFRLVQGSVDRVNAIASGNAQFGSIGLVGVLSVMAQGNKSFYWVGNQDQSQGAEGIVGGPNVKSIADLKGKKLGMQFGGSSELVDYFLLKQAGLDLYKDVQLINVQQSQLPQALSQGLIDAAGAYAPEYDRLQQLPGAKVIGANEDLFFWTKFGSTPSPDVLLLSKSFVDADPARAKRFMKAYFKAVDVVRSNEPEVPAIVAKYTKQEPPAVKDGMTRFIWRTYADQKKILSDQGLFGVVDFVADYLSDVAKKVPEKPKFREWVRADLVTD